MGKLPFIRLSELAAEVSLVIEETFGYHAFWVIADVTSHTYKARTNHHYFDLVEKDPASNTIVAKFATRSWSEGSERIAAFEEVTGQRFTNDINVLVLVAVQYHPVFGLQLTLIDIDTNFTLGTLEKQKQATLLRLLQENPDHVELIDEEYVTFNQQLTLNRVLQRIAIISSSTSAGYEDFVHTLENNDYGYAFQLDNYFTVVQGENNAKHIVDKLIEIYHSGVAYDAVVIIRGGGAQTDFLLFEQYGIGKAIARFPVPVITGIGHQKNETIADLMAHTATKTPTKAAEFIIAHNREFHDELLSLEKSIIIRSQQLLAMKSRELASVNYIITRGAQEYINQHKTELNRNYQLAINQAKFTLIKNKSALFNLLSNVALRPKFLLCNKSYELDKVVSKLKLANYHYLKSQQNNLNHYRSFIRIMSVENVLSKGFAIIKKDNKVISKSEDITIGKDISIIFAKEEISATVKAKKEYNGEDFNI